jgi:hypothetical protein
MYKGNAVGSSRRPVTQEGDMHEGNAADDAGWVVISRPRKQKTMYERNAVDSSRRPITQSGVMCKGNAADSVFGSNFKSTQPKSLKNKSLQAV